MSSQKLENYCLWCLKILIYLIPFLPLYISPSMIFPYITGKNFAFRIIVELSAALWVVLLAANRKYRLQNSAITLSILAFTFMVGLADIFGINPYNSFWSNYERMEGYVTILHLTVYFMIINSVFKTKRDWIIFLNLFLAVSVIVSFYALVSFPHVELGTYAFRASGTLGNPPFLASYLLLTIFIGLILVFKTQKPLIKYIYLISVALNSLVIYYTATRGAIVAVLIGATFFSLFYIFGKSNTLKEKMFKKAVLSVLALVILSTVLLWTFSDNNFIKQDRFPFRFHNIFSDPAVKSRLSAWEMAWEGVRERPFLGWGQENFIGIYTISPGSWKPLEGAWMDRAHNIVLDWLVNAGFLGCFSYMLIFGSAFYVIRKAFHKNLITKTGAVTIATALVVYFIQNLFTFDTINTYIVFFILLAYIDNLILPASPLINGKGEDFQSKKISYPEVNIEPKKPLIKPVSIILPALMIFSGAVYFINYKPLIECRLLYRIRASYPKNFKSYLTLLDDFKKALSFKTFGDTAVRLNMDEISYRIFRRKHFTEPGALKFIQTTAGESKKVVAANPYNLKYWTYLINFHNVIAYYEPSYIARTEALIKEGMSISPEYQWLYLVLADIYMLKKDYENAFLTAKKGTAINPQNVEMQLKLAQAAILASREKDANSALENIKKIRISRFPDISTGKKHALAVYELTDLARAYLKVKNFGLALQFYKEIINISPENAQYHFEIAMIYFKLNDKANAVREAEKAAGLDPLNYADEAEKFINSINLLN